MRIKPFQQFSLAKVMFGTTCVAVVLAVLPYPFLSFYLLLTLFFTAAILSRIGPVESRSFWRWFAACGWLYIFFGALLLDVLESSSLWFSIQNWLNRYNLSPKGWLPEDHLIFAHSLVALFIALVGAVSIP